MAEALRHGEAVYKYSDHPWRIRNGVPEVGVPRVDSAGVPEKSDDGCLVLDWEVLDEDDVFRLWPLEGWVLQ